VRKPQLHAAWVDSCAGGRLTPAVGKPRSGADSASACVPSQRRASSMWPWVRRGPRETPGVTGARPLRRSGGTTATRPPRPARRPPCPATRPARGCAAPPPNRTRGRPSAVINGTYRFSGRRAFWKLAASSPRPANSVGYVPQPPATKKSGKMFPLPGVRTPQTPSRESGSRPFQERLLRGRLGTAAAATEATATLLTERNFRPTVSP
jgi:hypothetical protein